MNNESKTTQNSQQIKAAFDLMRAIADIIREAGEIPSGHLYARLMEYGMSLETYSQIISTLKGAGLIEEDPSCLLHWQGQEPLTPDAPHRKGQAPTLPLVATPCNAKAKGK